MKTFTIADIRSWNPCYNPRKHLSEYWSGTALDILRKKKGACGDKLWVVLRSEALDDKTLRLFAVWCCRQVQLLMKDQRSIAALDVAERFANGNATEAELASARAEAEQAADEGWVLEKAPKTEEEATLQRDRIAMAAALRAARLAAAAKIEAAWVYRAAQAATEAMGDAAAADSWWVSCAMREVVPVAYAAVAKWAARERFREAQVAHLIKMLEQEA